MDEWESNFEAEIRHAQEARDQGNEGKARVCARRAAGVVIGAYFSSQNVSTSSASAYERLVQLKKTENLASEISQVLDHFLIRLNPNHELPVDADLIAEAVWLRQRLIGFPSSE